jgi:hypothetical protein
MTNPDLFINALVKEHAATYPKKWLAPDRLQNRVMAYKIRNWAKERGFDATLHEIADEFGISWERANALACSYGFGPLLSVSSNHQDGIGYNPKPAHGAGLGF